MKSTANRTRVIGTRASWVVTTALAGALLSGCTTGVAPSAALSASKAEQALAGGKYEKAVAHAEAAVLADPRNAAYRATLGSAYLDAGRFASAETSFTDAMQLGDTTARTALSLSLALSAQGKYQQSAALLNQWEGSIATADLGLALALAGQPERGIHLMSNAIRGGENNAKIRQNLAFSYALAGRWREARLMASQDVPGDRIDERIEQWALMASPDSWHSRVATLLQVPAGAHDAGQPVQLALANTPSLEELAGEANAFAAAEDAELPALAVASAPVNELPALPARDEAPVAARSSDFQAAFAPSAAAPAPSPVTQDAARFAQVAVVQPTPARAGTAAQPAPVRSAPARAAAPQADGTHLVQLGSFSSEQGARRAWSIYVKQYPELAGHEMVINEAVVRGKHYWRVSAAGFGRSTASSMCGRVKSSGGGCFAYAEGRPLPGAVDTGVRLARRD